MNILAHFYLSGESDQIMIGNFIADFIKTKRAESFQKKICQGILLHREIDDFTNRHDQFTRSKKRLWPRHRHYSSVIVDIFYDHFLASNWEKYSTVSLEEFARNAYATMNKFEDILPEAAREVFPHIRANNWLVNYRLLDGVQQTMQGLSKRARFPSQMASAVEDLRKDYDSYGEEFKLFFPELITHSTTCLNALAKSSSCK